MTRTLPDNQDVVARVQGLVRSFGPRRVIDRLDLTLHRGEITALIGHSGCGKTTFLRTLAGLDRPDGGTLAVPGRVSVVFQEPRLLPWRRVRDNVTLGQSRAGQTQADAGESAARILAEVGLSHRIDAWPATLSGGEAQRVALARALMTGPELLLLDEPFAALDALTRLRMHGLIRDLILRHRPATLLVTHDVDEAIYLADRIIVMREGRIAQTVDVTAIGEGRDNPAAARIRRLLLAELGVDFPASEPDALSGPDTAQPEPTKTAAYATH